MPVAACLIKLCPLRKERMCLLIPDRWSGLATEAMESGN